MKKQDFSNRITIVVNKELPVWQVLNCVGHISAYFGAQLGENFGTAKYFETMDRQKYPRNSQYPIIILGATKEELQQFSKEMETVDIEQMSFIREMIETTDDENIEALLSLKTKQEVECLGMGLFGENKLIKTLTSRFKLWS